MKTPVEDLLEHNSNQADRICELLRENDALKRALAQKGKFERARMRHMVHAIHRTLLVGSAN